VSLALSTDWTSPSFLNWLFEAVAWVLLKIHSGLSLIFQPDSGPAWVLSIVVLVVIMRLLMVPLFVKQIHSTRKMQEIQPKLQELRKKYKNDKQRLNQEMQKVMQESGANPLGGCLPLLVQAPVFYGLFHVLRAISGGKPMYGIDQATMDSASHATLFGAHISGHFSTSAPLTVQIVIICACLISSCTTFLTVRQSTRRSMTQMPDNPMAKQQKMMMYVVPLFGLFGLSLPIGVLVYWVTTNVWTLVQQHFIYKRIPLTSTATAGATGGGGSAPTPAKGAKPSSNGGPAPRLLGGVTPFGKSKNSSGKGGQNGQDAEPEAPKIVRTQPQRQTRSKRSGKK
jgi:YidC/Oxa1 family membrane protein insertase